MIHVILAVAVILFAFGIGRMIPYLRARNWVACQARIMAIREDWSDEWVGDGGHAIKHYFPRVEYEYQFEGSTYRSSRVSFERQNVWVPEANHGPTLTRQNERFWDGWKTGDAISIHVNSRHPDESVIVSKLGKSRRSHHLAVAIGGALILQIWFFLFWTTVRD